MLSIDGSTGEGGGQIVRSSLALAAVTGTPISIDNVRARRKRPGLRRQHVTAAKAVAEISGARLAGASVGSRFLEFHPSGPVGGDYSFRIDSAGSTLLVLQTVLPPLLTAAEPSTLRLEGGTHNPFAPPFDFLERVYLPLLNRMGANVTARLERHGFYPAGGGRITVQVRPAATLSGLTLLQRGKIRQRRVQACVANLPLHIAQRECHTIAERSGWPAKVFRWDSLSDAEGPGNFVFIEIECEHLTELFTGFGQKGISAERVAAQVWREADEYLSSGVPVGPYLADQLLLLAGLATTHGAHSAYRTLPPSLHTSTHAEILRQFLAVELDMQQQEPGICTVRVGPG
jgi:RNA 3'-terminal phosphate cyclase (ATP)